MSDQARKLKTNIKKQEIVVGILWEFARDIQLKPNEGTVATACGSDLHGTKCSLTHIANALRKTLETFGYTARDIS